MTVYYAIVEGDPLDNGSDSRVIGGSDHSIIEDQHGRPRRQTHLGQEAWCGVCKSFGPILAGAGIKEDLRGWDGRLKAFEAVSGDIVLCKCERHPRVVAVYARSCTYEDYESGGFAVAPSIRSASAPCATYDEQFTLTDSEGRALADTYYTVCLPDGKLIRGTTDASGRTSRHKTDDVQTVRIYLGHREEV
ncbi:PAAR motif-containing protein [Paraburkholderia sacchari]|uniref:PAAR domain-containing protein n=1 Tax=Paraburkholderia sacchari TaxID=159450 RepID=UPI0039A6B615